MHFPAGTPVEEIAFRLAVDSDAPCIGVLATQVFLDTYATQGVRPAIAREVLERLSTDAISARLSNPDVAFIIAESKGHVVGFAQLTLGASQELVPSKAAAELDRLYVQERFTGQGIGTALLHRAESLAAARGASTLWLTAWVGNSRALAFYASRAYRDLGATMHVLQGESHENRVFAKVLHDKAAT